MINAAWTASRGWLAASAVVCACAFLPLGAEEEGGVEQYRQMLIEAQAAEPKTVADDIAALRQFHRAAKRAARRLAERGDQILPQLIEALRSPESNDKQRQQLINLLGEIGNESAIEPMIQLADAHPEWPGERRQILLALTYLPQTEASVGFAQRMAEGETEHEVVRRTAVVYFAKFRDTRGRKYVDAMVADSNVDNRAVGLYLAARLGDDSVKDGIVRLLGRPAPWSLRGFLLTGLSDVADAEEIERTAPAYLRESDELASALRLARFRTGSTAQRVELSRAMLGSSNREEKLRAARFILENQGVDGLAGLLRGNTPPDVRAVARHELRRAGYRVVPRGHRENVERKPAR